MHLKGASIGTYASDNVYQMCCVMYCRGVQQEGFTYLQCSGAQGGLLALCEGQAPCSCQHDAGGAPAGGTCGEQPCQQPAAALQGA